MSASEPSPNSDPEPSPPSPPTGAPAAGAGRCGDEEDEEDEERAGLQRQLDVLLTTSSILAGFALSGLMSLAEAGGLDRAAAASGFEPSAFAFPVAHFCTLVATIAFIGVLVGIVSSRLRLRGPSLRSLRRASQASIGVYGLGLSALFAATITVGVPTVAGMTVGVAGGLAITFGLVYRVRRGI